MAEGLRWRRVDDETACGQGELFPDRGVLDRHVGTGEYRGLEFLHVSARRVINRVPGQSRMPFRWTINAYRGCSHACTYCFARPTHEWLGLGLGEDFERRIVVKVNAVERVRAELASPRWTGEVIAMGTNTDPYQRAEGKYRLTRGIVEALGEAANPFSILTKSTLVLGDLDRLVAASRRASVRVNLSIATLDEEVWRAAEPGTPHPRQRLAAVRRINEAGIPCGVLVAPVLPGLSDRPEQVEEVVGACVEAGAVSVSASLLHLRPGVKEHYLGWLASFRPDLAEACARRYGGRAYLPRAEQQALSALVSGLRRGRRLPGRRRRSAGPGSSDHHPDGPGAARHPAGGRAGGARDGLDVGAPPRPGEEGGRRASVGPVGGGGSPCEDDLVAGSGDAPAPAAGGLQPHGQALTRLQGDGAAVAGSADRDRRAPRRRDRGVAPRHGHRGGRGDGGGGAGRGGAARAGARGGAG